CSAWDSGLFTHFF
nr:immunoglobulin light chain junction region [Macaca mulatta]MPO03666.1 immunoglobulin light chain junction region [Macaca mulatta]MPO07045.1 immunoglobulin light chain junction region [Macaca mulatta]MPO07140.1 immunoglobulin light chain junction region [Macaca mulatta]MPO07166.1 immunoglobulin light chain junction region [Macaca mulatta]